MLAKLWPLRAEPLSRSCPLPQLADLALFPGSKLHSNRKAGDVWEVGYAGPAADVVAGWERWTVGDALVHP